MTTLVWHDVRGRSMWPLEAPLQAGVAVVATNDLQPGDIVAFIAGHAPVLWVHRVVRVEFDAVITRGDTNGYDDPPVPFSAILGRVAAVRWGPWTLPLADRGPLARWQRRAGQAWAQLAPGLRRRFARQKTRGSGT